METYLTYGDIEELKTKLALIIDAVNQAIVPDEIDDIIDHCHRHLVLAYRQMQMLHYENPTGQSTEKVA